MRKTVLEDILLELKTHSSLFPGVVVLTVILEMPVYFQPWSCSLKLKCDKLSDPLEVRSINIYM